MSFVVPETGEVVSAGVIGGSSTVSHSQTTTTVTGGAVVSQPGTTVVTTTGGPGTIEFASEDGESFLVFIDGKKVGQFMGLEGQSMTVKGVKPGEHKPQRQLSFLVLLDELVQIARCQAVIATHSPILMSYPDAWIYSFDETGVKETSLEETEHYRITKDFLAAPERFFRNLFRRD